MKKLLFGISILLFTLSSCSTSEDEKKLKEHYKRLEAFAETPEEKEALREEYKNALEELRKEKKEQEEKSKIFYSESSDVTSELLAFCDELWADEKYNPAKYNVKQKEFKWKSVTLKGKVAYVVSENDRHYVTMYYKKETVKLDWLNEKSRSIIFLINFDKPEDIMNFKEGQEFSVKAVYDYSHKSEGVFDGQNYFFNFFNPIQVN